MSGKADPWVTWFRALLGAAVLGWELPIDHVRHWPTLVIAAWLLGAPLEAIVRFLTEGRLQIQIRKDKDE